MSLNQTDKLKIWEIACLLSNKPDADKIDHLMKELRATCQGYYIKYEGSLFSGIEKKPLERGPTKPIVKVIDGKQTVVGHEAVFFEKKYFSGFDALLSKDEVQKYLELFNQWPLVQGVPLSNWWKNNDNQSLAHIKWFRDIWNKEGMPKGSKFFEALKKYNGEDNSPVLDWYLTGQDGAGIKLKYAGGKESHYSKKQIQKLPCRFTNEIKQQKNLSSKN